MFQFPRFPPAKRRVPRLFIETGYPIRRSPAELARQQSEAYRSLATSFIGFQRLGIHRAPIVAWTTSPLPPQRGWGASGALPIRLLTCSRLAAGLPCSSSLGWGSPAPSVSNRKEAGPMLADLPHAPDLYLTLGYSLVKSGPSANLTSFPVIFGGAGGTRTPDFRLAKAALSQLSYGPTAPHPSGGRWWTRTTDLGLIRTAL
jgi:hypothetical protein